MRGLLLITAARSPYLRAGLSFPLAAPVDIRDLDGERLLELARDPVLTISMGTDVEDVFEPIPAIDESVGPEQAQLMIDSLAKAMPERAVLAAAVDPATAGDKLATIEVALASAGFSSFDDAIVKLGKLGTDLEKIEAAGFDTLDQLLDELGYFADVTASVSEAGFASIDDLLTEANEARVAIPMLRSQLAAANASLDAIGGVDAAKGALAKVAETDPAVFAKLKAAAAKPAAKPKPDAKKAD